MNVTTAFHRPLGQSGIQVIIATKFVNVIDTERQRLVGTDARPEYIRQTLEASLRRLGTDYVELMCC